MKNEIKEVEESNKVSEIDVDTIQEELVEVESIEEPTSEEEVVERVEALFETEKACNAQDNKYQEILDKVKELVVPRKKLLIGASTIAIVGVVGFSIVSPSVNSVFGDVKRMIDKGDFSVDFAEYINDKYANDLGIFKELNAKKIIKVTTKSVNYLSEVLYKKSGININDEIDKSTVRIDNVEIEQRSYYSDYVDINITFTNNSSNRKIRYIKVNLLFEDASGNIVQSDWTNDSSTVYPGARQTITKMAKKDGWKRVRAVVDEVKFY